MTHSSKPVAQHTIYDTLMVAAVLFFLLVSSVSAAPTIGDTSTKATLGNDLIGGSKYIYSVQGLSIATTTTSTAAIVFSDGTIQTTAFSESGTGTLSAGQITPGTFGSVGGDWGNYIFLDSVGTDTVLKIDAINEYVGIGTASPGYALEVDGDIALSYNATPKKIFFERSTGGFTGQLYMDGTSGGTKMIMNAASGVGIIDLQIDSTSAIYINASRNVGIGTGSPNGKLEVKGDSATAVRVVAGTDSVGADASLLLREELSNVDWIIYIDQSDSEKLKIRGDSSGGGTPLDRLTIVGASGNVGIGTNTPYGKLHVTNTGWTDQTASSDTASFPVSGTGGVVLDGHYVDGRYRTRFVKIDRSANLALYVQESKGTANSYTNIARFGNHSQSTVEFEVFGDINATGNITADGSITADVNAGNVSTGIFGSLSTKGNYTFQAAGNTNTVLFVDAANERVGIGTTGPSLPLHVVGQGQISDYWFNFTKSQSSGDGVGWWHVATLPISSGSTGDQLTAKLRGGRYPYEMDYSIIMGNRNGFSASIMGQAEIYEANSRVQAYSQGDGSVKVYAYLANDWGKIGLDLISNYWLGGVTFNYNPNKETSTPAGTLVFDSYTYGTNSLRMIAGNVGIGTASPASDASWAVPGLDISGTRGTAILRTTSASGIATLRMTGPGASSVDDWHINMKAGAASTLTFNALAGGGVGANILVLKNDGNVGIGTASPGYKLEVSGGDLYITGGALGVNVAPSTTDGSITANSWIKSNSNIYAVGSAGFVFGASTGDGEYIYRSGNDIRILAGGSDRLIIDGDAGNVGIGTTVPPMPLSVNGAVDIRKTMIGASNGSSSRWTHFARLTLPSSYDHVVGKFYLADRYRQWVLNVDVSNGTPYSTVGQQSFILEQLHNSTDPVSTSYIKVGRVDTGSQLYWDIWLLTGSWRTVDLQQALIRTESSGSVTYYSQVYSGTDGADDPLVNPGGYTEITTSDDLYTPGGLTVVDDLTVSGASTNFQNAVKAVDGSGSGIDADLLDGISSASFLRSDVSGTMSQILTLTNDGNALTLAAASPQIYFNDSTEDDFWVHINSNNFYVLADRDGNGSWESPHPLQLEADTNTAIIFGGTGKLDVGTIDPIYTIGGTRYATYMIGMTGVKEETTGVVRLSTQNQESGIRNQKLYEYVIDFDELEIGSDIWLFAQTVNVDGRAHITEDGTIYRTTSEELFDNMTILLTPSFEGDVWYEKDVENKQVVIYAQLKEVQLPSIETLEVSYRLTAPRFDWKYWKNTTDSKTEGFNLDKLLQ